MAVRLSILLLLVAVAGASTDSGALRGFLSDPGHTVPGDPSLIPGVATNLRVLSLSNNNFSGSIPSFICNLTHLVILDLSNNNFFGELPNCWQKSQLGTVDSQNDSMSGHSQSLVAGPISLQSLHMRNNNLSGGIPLFLKYCKNLSVLDLSENKFSGNLPNWIGENLASLKVLSLRSNSFSGNIPEQLSHLTLLQVLDLSSNNFSGALPRSFGNFNAMKNREIMDKSFSSIYYYQYSIVMIIKGLQIECTRVLSLVTSIDISSNNLSGIIPQELVNLLGLRFLNLSSNHFIGEIPKNIGALEQLESLDLSMNNLSGNIPSTMPLLNFLERLNLSYNNLSGSIPTGNQMQTFCDHSIYFGNPHLQWPLPSCFNNASSRSPRPQEEEYGNKGKSRISWLYVGFALGHVVGLSGFIYTPMIKRAVRIAYFQFIDKAYDYIYVELAIRFAKLKTILMNNFQG